MTVEQNCKKIELLERRLHREKSARIATESILETKSMELYYTNQKLVDAVLDLEKLTVAIEQSPIIVLMTDFQGVVEYVNQSFTVISGYTKQQVMGKKICDLELFLNNEPMEGIKHVLQNKTSPSRGSHVSGITCGSQTSAAVVETTGTGTVGTNA